MAGAYVYTPRIWLPLAAAILLAGISLYGWRRRDVPGARWLAIGSLLGCLLPLAVALEAAAVLPAVKIAWHTLQGAFALPVTGATTCFALEYTSAGRWLTRRNLALLWLPALLGLLVIIISNGEVLGPALITPDGSVRRTESALIGILLAYAVLLFLVNTAAFLWLFAHSPHHRWPVALMLFGQLAGRGLFFLDVLPFDSGVPFDPVAGSTLLIWTMYAIALFAFRIFDPLPAARRAALEQMHSGVVVFDARWRVLGLNPAAETVLGVRANFAAGKTWQQLRSAEHPLPALPDSVTYPAGAGIELPDMTFGSGSEARQCAPALSPLRDFRGLPVGHLLMLHDVTEQRRAHAEVLERQGLQATLRERERLGRELHDGIGQVLGFASLKLGAARKLMADGKLAKADDQLAALERVVADAHADLREYILNLRVAPSEARPFLAALRHYIDGYRQNYGIQVDLSVAAEVDEGAFSTEAQMQLFRILQEALSNARKHAQTDCVWVSFEKAAGPAIRMRVRDNGRGFDPLEAGSSGAAQAPDSHFGLRFMRERAEQLGGVLRIESAPGQGTCVEVEVPV